MTLTYLNGDYVLDTEAKISVKDRGLKFGDGVFETIAVHGGIPYQWDLHEKRLNQSLDAIGLKFPTAGLQRIAADLLVKNNAVEAVLRITITRGPAGRAYAAPREIHPTVILETFPMPERPAAPISLFMSPWKKISPAALPIHTKTLQCLNSVLSRTAAEENGCFEALLMSEKGHICECSSANIFWFKGNTLFTPAKESGILLGTTRSAVIRLSPYKVAEGIFTLEEMQEADEIFLSNVTLKAMPVGKLAWHDAEWKHHPKTTEIYNLVMDDIKNHAPSRTAAVG